MSIGRIRGIRVKLISASIPDPLSTPDGTSLEEKMNVWFSATENQALNLIEVRYQAPNVSGGLHVAMILYTL